MITDEALVSIAATARRALRCEGVVVWIRDVGGEIAHGADGLTPARERALVTGTIGEVGPDSPACVEVSFDAVGRSGAFIAVPVAGTILEPSLVAGFARYAESMIAFRGSLAPGAISKLDLLGLASASFADLILALREMVKEEFGEVIVGMTLWDAESRVLKTVPGSFEFELDAPQVPPIDPADLHSNAARVFETQCPFLSNNVVGDPAVLQSYVEAFRLSSLLAVPLTVNAQPIGVLLLGNKPSGFTPADLRHACAIAPRIAVAVALTLMNERTSFQQRVERTISELSLAVAAHGLDYERLSDGLTQLVALLEANELVVRDTRSDDILAVATGHGRWQFVGQLNRMARPCGEHRELRVIRHGWSDFSREERDALRRAAELLSAAQTTEHLAEERIAVRALRERQELADSLHDSVAQLLFAAELLIDDMEAAPRCGEHLGELSAIIGSASRIVRDVIQECAVDDRLSISQRLRVVVRELEVLGGPPVRIEMDLAVDGLLSSLQAEPILRAVRELIVNAKKHAKAAQIFVSVSVAEVGEVKVVVRDDGVGFVDEWNPGYGIASIHRQLAKIGARLAVVTLPGLGSATEISVGADRGASLAVETAR